MRSYRAEWNFCCMLYVRSDSQDGPGQDQFVNCFIMSYRRDTTGLGNQSVGDLELEEEEILQRERIQYLNGPLFEDLLIKCREETAKKTSR